MAGRPKKGSGTLAPLQGEVMEVVWRAGVPVTVREVLRALNERRAEPLAYTTVMTVMNRLVASATLVRHGERRSFTYEATATDAAGLAVREVIRLHGDAALAHFIDEASVDPALLERLRRLLGEPQDSR
jgi:predicted transcriptional regulator